MTEFPDESFRRRSRIRYLLGMILVIGLGLLWRSHLFHLPPGLAKYGGDALWALLVFLLCGWVFPRLSTSRVAAISLALACVVEFGQLYHAPWIDSIRKTRLGALALGSVFNWPDIPAYALGVVAGVFVEVAANRRAGRRMI